MDSLDIGVILKGYLDNPPKTFERENTNARYEIAAARLSEDDELVEVYAVVRLQWTGERWYGREAVKLFGKTFQVAVLAAEDGSLSTKWLDEEHPFEAWGAMRVQMTNTNRRAKPVVFSARTVGTENANNPVHVKGSRAGTPWSGPRTPLAHAIAELSGTHQSSRGSTLGNGLS